MIHWMIQSEKSDIQFIIMTDSQLIEWFWNEWTNQQLKISVLNSSPPCPDLDSYLDEVLEKAGRRGRVFFARPTGEQQIMGSQETAWNSLWLFNSSPWKITIFNR